MDFKRFKLYPNGILGGIFLGFLFLSVAASADTNTIAPTTSTTSGAAIAKNTDTTLNPTATDVVNPNVSPTTVEPTTTTTELPAIESPAPIVAATSRYTSACCSASTRSTYKALSCKI